jgi:hypothetical protein
MARKLGGVASGARAAGCRRCCLQGKGGWAVLTAALLWAGPAIAEGKKPGGEGVDTEHIFGFTEGSDIGEKGEAEIENALVVRFGKVTGFRAAENETAYRYVIADHFRVSLATRLDEHTIDGVSGLTGRNGLGFGGLASELRWQLLDHDKAPAGMTLSLTPEWHRIDEVSGARSESYALPVSILVDRVLIPNKFFAALNLTFAPGVSRTGEGWQHNSAMEISAAASYAVTPEVYLGAEIRHLSGDSFTQQDLFAAHGLYIGPSAYFKIPDNASLKFAWSVQVPDETTGRLNLRDFERHQVLVQLVKSF